MGVLYPKSKDMYKTNSLDESDLLVHCCVMLEILKLRHFLTVDGLGNYGWITHVLTQVLFVIWLIADAVIEQANWDMSKARDKFQRDIDAHIASVRAAKLGELTAIFEV